jgi:hypothetical protein
MHVRAELSHRTLRADGLNDVDSDAVVLLLKKRIGEAGSMCKFSARTGVHTAQLSLTVRGHIKPPPCVLVALGLRRMVTYESR